LAQECEEDIKKGKNKLHKTNKAYEASKNHFFGSQTMTFENSDEDVIYEAVTDLKNSSFLVSLNQINDIVGEEDWIHGESNCLVNLASGRTITLSWGAKKKEHKEQCRLLSDESLQVGDLVVVKNHGHQWPHQAHIMNIDMENKLAMIKWETTQKTNSVDIRDFKRFSIEDSTKRKQKSLFFFSFFRQKNASNKQHQSDRSDMQNCKKIGFFLQRIPLSCALKVQLVIS
jgi:hypothetical protein